MVLTDIWYQYPNTTMIIHTNGVAPVALEVVRIARRHIQFW